MAYVTEKSVWPRVSSHISSYVFVVGIWFLVAASAQTAAPVAKAVGTVKSVSSNSVVLITDNGSEITVTVSDATRLIRATPGQTDLKNAPTIALSDIQVGDRFFARGQAGDGNSVVASSAIVMAKSDIADRQQQEREQWRRGVGGIVKEVDPAAGAITVANALATSGKPIIIHVAADTTIRRYSPDSVNFDNAKPGTIDQIKPGDQLCARGTKNADGTEFTAQAIVSGTFRDIAGTVVSSDPANNSITVTDLATKKQVVVKVAGDSQLRKLPPQVAQMIAMRLRGLTPGGNTGQSPAGAAQQAASGSGRGNWSGAQGNGQGSWRGDGNGSGSAAAAGSGTSGPGGTWRGSGGGPPDFQQMLSRMPVVTVSDLQKGDAVILVSTEGSSASGPTVITLLAGVEPILTAAPAGTRASTILSPWNLGAPAGAGGDAGQ
jgi:hypothetical protein